MSYLMQAIINHKKVSTKKSSNPLDPKVVQKIEVM